MEDIGEKRQLALRIVYVDEHLIELECNLTYRGWAGVARAYSSFEAIRTFANDLKEFIETLSGESTLVAGNESGIGLVALRFYTIDRAGHVACHVRMQTDDKPYRAGHPWLMAVEMSTEVAAIDRFAKDLTILAQEKSKEAVLKGVLP